MATQYNIVDLFSGAGGISCGFEQAGFKTLLGVDFDQHAINTFSANHPAAKSFCGDIRKLSNEQISHLIGGKKVHVVVGGPPCQGFSTVGLGNPKDKRNHLFLEFCRVVEYLKPEFVMMENVTGLLAKKNEKTLLNIFKQFSLMGYHLQVKVLSAHNFGVAEKRKRTIMLASKLNVKLSFPMETHEIGAKNGLKPALTVGDAFRLLKKENLLNHELNWAKVKNELDLARIKAIPEGKSIRYEEDEKAYFGKNRKKLSLGIKWEKMPENRLRQAKYLRLSTKEPSPTILTHRHTYFHPKEHRYLTAREAATIQSFPLDFEFMGPISSQWRQIGNAVPPLLAFNMAKHIKLLMKKAKETKIKIVIPKLEDLEDIRGRAFHYH